MRYWPPYQEDKVASEMQCQRDPRTGIFIVGDSPRLASTPMTVCPKDWNQCEHWITIGTTTRRCTTRMQITSDRKYCYEHEKLQHSIAHRCLYFDCKEFVDNTVTYCQRHCGGILGLAKQATTFPDLASGEDVIDTQLAERLERSPLRYRHYRKLYSMDTIHYKVEIKGTPMAVLLYHTIIGDLDHEYPFRPDRTGTTVPGCEKCHGYVWERATLNPSEWVRLAKQCKVYVKTRHYCTGTRCGGTVKDVAVGAA